MEAEERGHAVNTAQQQRHQPALEWHLHPDTKQTVSSIKRPNIQSVSPSSTFSQNIFIHLSANRQTVTLLFWNQVVSVALLCKNVSIVTWRILKTSFLRSSEGLVTLVQQFSRISFKPNPRTRWIHRNPSEVEQVGVRQSRLPGCCWDPGTITAEPGFVLKGPERSSRGSDAPTLCVWPVQVYFRGEGGHEKQIFPPMLLPLSQSKHWTIRFYTQHAAGFVSKQKYTTEVWKEFLKTTEINNINVKTYNQDNNYNG